ncbi:MAG: ferritin-like domain-containing protein [Bdellovibrionales bacterium]|nr:ferritin-like domain-containing protein [Bdellovibrionales bacterium]
MNEWFDLDKVLEAPHLQAGHPLIQILDPMLSARGATPNRTAKPHLCWAAERFGLQKSSAFRALKPTAQEDILLRLTELNLSLSYFIEKSGHHYAAKMILSSPALEEKTFYALMASEEATHLRFFMNAMWFQPTLKTHFHPMLPILAETIQWGTRDCLVFVIQVLLEGFGIAHYSSLRENCIDEDLKNDFQTILRDEAKHHGAGLVLSKEQRLTQETSDQIFELSRKFIRAMEGAHWISEAFGVAGKPLSSTETQTLFGELGFQSTLEVRMQRLREMFQKVNYQSILDRLDKEGAFRISSL